MSAVGPISTIAIIGAGATGIACAKYLIAENVFSSIEIFEQRPHCGGIWNMTSNIRSKRVPAPQTDPRYGSRTSPHTSTGEVTSNGLNISMPGDNLELEGPLYEHMETNIPKQLMQFADFQFPDEVPLFPDKDDVLEYLQRYADDVRHLIRFEMQVQNVRMIERESSESGSRRWELTTKSLKTGDQRTDIYDAVVVCNGHYTVPIIPKIAGLEQWSKAYPHAVRHSKAYRKPDSFAEQTVLIIGNAASGSDIAYHIAPFSKKLYLSSRSESMFPQKKVSWREDIEEVVEFLPPSSHARAVRTKSKRKIEGIDTVIFCTGYFYSFPFLSSLDPPIITDGQRTHNLYEHFLHSYYPELAIPALNVKVIPFRLAESQAAVIARLWSGRLPMPSEKEMQAWEEAEISKKGSGKSFHSQTFPDDGQQINKLYRWAASANRKEGLVNHGNGAIGEPWDRKLVWIRSRFADLRAAFVAKGEERRLIKTTEQIGFNFHEWLSTAGAADQEMFRGAECPAEDLN